ncbi:hypothetical protein [Colwellia hornerae]|uniref:Uncharacterized protein n=1 Tax=Colwellia hornerae TaxID=89402 RepID=A0A5C6Q2I4_9GAMM|nr:hypothetical protein [Colwellia hornerae]TWX45747.1 hypothetical protein ESZ28_18515 [Colwellia hornerae]TWX53823.1 hypothetical protein ESZ26_18510 [Colwellia hornerae]TWX62982.1 hypothetical protein ESZ27_18400 [Colwellia hornerae]
MDLEKVMLEIIESMAGSIHEGFKGAISGGHDTIKIGSFKVMRYAEVIEKNFGKSQLKPIVAILHELMVARAIEKKNYASIDFYLSEQAATVVLITAIEILINSKGWFSFSGKNNYRNFEENGYQISFLGDDYTSWEFSALEASFVSITKSAELNAQIQHLNPVA